MIVLKILAGIIIFNIIFFVGLYLWSEYKIKKVLTKGGHYDNEPDEYDAKRDIGI